MSLIHNGQGQLEPLSRHQRRVYDTIAALTAPFYTVQNQSDFQRNLTKGRPNAWQCGAGGRYRFICEEGLVHWYSQQRGYPGVPLANYTRADVERESRSEKSCSPLCTVSCVHRVALLDRLRAQPMETIDDMLPRGGNGPVSVRLLRWGLVTSRHRDRFRAVAARLLSSRS